MKTKTAISFLILSFTALGTAHADLAVADGQVQPHGSHHAGAAGRTTNDDPNNIPFGGVHGHVENGLTREQVLEALRTAPRPGPFDELPLGQGDSGV